MMNNLEILYEDNHIIVVVKPVNVLSQADDTKDIDMLTMIKKYLKEKYHKPGNVYLGLVHRLDRPVGGVMVFAKTSKAASRLTEQVKNHQFHKKYYAIVHDDGTLKSEDVLKDFMCKDENNNGVITDADNGKYAELSYKIVKHDALANLSLVDISLKTGRHHQIRVQFASRKHPLLGDQRYGVQDKKQIMLFSYQISFVHPTSKEIMTFTVPLPNHDEWRKFKI